MIDSLYKWVKENRIKAYLFCMLAVTAVFYLLSIRFNFFYKCILFFNDYDTFMDFYNMLPFFKGDWNPYLKYSVGEGYPAGAIWAFKIMASASLRYIEISDRYQVLRWQYAQMVFMLFNAFCYFISGISIRRMAKLTGFEKDCLYIILLLSMPAMFAFERGNIINLAVAFTFFFVAFSDHENKWIRALAYVSLGLAASVKIYPAIFGFYMIKKRGIKSALILAVTGVLIFYLLFLPFGGMKAIAGHIRGVLSFTNDRVESSEDSAIVNAVGDAVSYESVADTGESVIEVETVENDAADQETESSDSTTIKSGTIISRIEKGSLPMQTDYAFNISFKNGWRIWENILGIQTSDRICTIVMLLFVILLGICAAVTGKEWKELLCYALIMLIAIPFSGPYMLLFLFIPFIKLLNEVKSGEKGDLPNIWTIIVLGVFALIILPYPSGLSIKIFEKEGQLKLPWRTLLNMSYLAALTILLSFDGIKDLKISINKINKQELKKAE